MDKIRPNKNFFSPAIFLGISFLTILFVYFIFFVYPSYRSFYQTRQAIAEQSKKVERLKVLDPISVRSRTLEQIKFKPGLPLPRRIQIPQNEFSKISRKISDTAMGNHMTMSGNDFDINSLNNQSVSMIIELRGKLIDFRQFLIEIIGFKFFDSIEKLTIDSDKDQIKKFTLNLNIWIKKNPL